MLALLLTLACRPAAPPANPVDEAPPVGEAPAPVDEAPPAQEVTVDRLEDFGTEPFELRLDGTAQEGQNTEGTAVWWSVTHGKRDQAGAWQTWQTMWNTKDDVVLLGADGKRLTVSWRSLRVHIAPTWSKQWTGDEPDCPPPLTEWVASNGGPVTVVEYALVRDKTYWGRVDGESYRLPPDGPDGEPKTRVNHVLRLADGPFGEELPPIDPLFSDWSY